MLQAAVGKVRAALGSVESLELLCVVTAGAYSHCSGM